MNNSYRVEVIARHLMDGSTLHLAIIWMDGRNFAVDKVRSCMEAFSSKSGGIIKGRKIYEYVHEI